MFDAPSPAFPVLAKTNVENDKNDDGVFYFGAALLTPPKSGGVGRFSLDHSPPLSSMVTLSTSP